MALPGMALLKRKPPALSPTPIRRAGGNPTGPAARPALPEMDAAPRSIVPLLALIAALWLATRRYEGVVQDARFYMVQALRHLDPPRFAPDLYFLFGSQDRFSIFTWLYSPLVERLGVGTTGILCTLAGQLLWVCGLIYCARGLIGCRRLALLAVAAVIALPNTYTIFGYGEAVVTPRLFAEALTLIALGLVLRRHTAWALVALAAAAVLHPLMALPGLAVLLIYLALGEPLWWGVIGAGTAATVGLALANIQPFANLHATFDPAWFRIVAVRDAQCLITGWSATAYFRMLGTIALTILTLILADRSERRFLIALLAVGVGGVVCTLFGGDVARDVFIVQVQPWRSMWLLTVIAQLYAIPTLVRLRRRDDIADVVLPMFLVALVALLASQFVPPIIFASAPLMLATLLLAVWQFGSGRRIPPALRILSLCAIACVGAVTIDYAYAMIPFLRPWHEAFDHRVWSFALVAATVPIMAAWLWPGERPHPTVRRWLPWLALVLVPLALANWDSRTPWTKFVESSQPVPQSLASILPQNASVYWEGGVEMLWFKLRRPSYFSCAQGTGAVFFRDTAIEFQRRARLFWPLRTLDFGSILCPRRDGTPRPVRTRAELRQLCGHKRAPDYLVLVRPVADVKSKIWISPAAYTNVKIRDGRLAIIRTDRFYVYSCAAATGTAGG